MIFKSFYRLGGSPDQRLILRKLAELYDAGMIHDHKTETTVITSPNQEADKEIYRRFTKIVNHGRMKAATAAAVFPELNARAIRSQFWLTFTDLILARLDGKKIVDASFRSSSSKWIRFCTKAARECDIS